MIKSLKLTNFRQHTDLALDFSEGLNVLRGPNEVGKSACIESCLYALYGAKVLRDSLSETVTWGHKENTLKVELVIEADGVTYQFNRAKAGAEVIKGGKVFVTGQTEVSAFAAQLLGADAKTASSLMLADQSGLRGVLEDGPAAVSGLMAKLADFAIIDNIIEAMQATLLLGSDAPIREKLRTAEAELAEAVAAMPDEGKVAKIEEEVGLAKKALEKWQKQRNEVEAPAYNAAVEKLTDAEAAFKARSDAVVAVDKAQERLGKVVSDLDDAKGKVIEIDHDRIAALRREIFDADAVAKRRHAWNLFNALADIPEMHWDGDSDSFHTHVAKVRKELNDLNAKSTTIRNQIADAKRRKVEGGVCKVCGTDISQRKDIVENNAAVDAEVAALTLELDKITESASTLSEEAGQLEKVARSARAYAEALPTVLKPFVVEENLTVPSRFVWVGEQVSSELVSNAEELKAELSALEKAADASNRAEGEVTALERALAQAKQDYADVAARLQITPEIDLGPVNAAFRAASDALSAVDDKVFKAEAWYNQAKASLDELNMLTASCLTKVNTAKTRICEYTADIEAVGFNNTLLKKMRGIKPLVTDRLWCSVLASVSQLFTKMRKEPSLVTKGGDGFIVNGTSSKSLSGSTLDILAIATRVALSKTFLPCTDFIVLDEPAHAADEERTSAILGFLNTCGYRQVVLATHDRLSSSVATSVIDLVKE